LDIIYNDSVNEIVSFLELHTGLLLSAKPFYNMSLPLLIQPHSVVIYASGMYWPELEQICYLLLLLENAE